MSEQEVGDRLSVKSSTVGGMSAWILENSLISLTVVPELGGRIYNLVYKPLQHDFLWQNSRVPPSRIGFGSVYDDNFWGGWDELFPNDEAAQFGTSHYPDHGEFWSVPWKCRPVEGRDEVGVTLQAVGRVTGVCIRKRITVRRGKSQVYFHHRLENKRDEEMPFLWKLHPCFRISEHHRIDLPTNRMRLEREYSTVVKTDVREFDWPFCPDSYGHNVDLRFVPSKESETTLFAYGTELREGWFALTDLKSNLGFGYSFPVSVFPTCWIFASFGGWLSNYCLLLEPSSGYPSRFEEGVKAGTYPRLKPLEAIDFKSVCAIYRGLKEVSRVTAEGNVTGI